MLQNQLRYLIENVLQPLVVGGLSSFRKMRNLSGETRNRAAAIDVISVGRRQTPPNLADQWISPSSPRLGDRSSELLPPLVHNLADHLGNERFFGKMVIEASLGEPASRKGTAGTTRVPFPEAWHPRHNSDPRHVWLREAM